MDIDIDDFKIKIAPMKIERSYGNRERMGEPHEGAY
jgi:hypothetical protein